MIHAYRLHYAPDNASMIIRLMLEELRIDYTAVLVDRAQQAQRAPAYLALNPHGLIPVLETPDGPLFETGAILLWLADRHPDRALAPLPGDADRGEMLKWLFYLSNTLHPALRMLFYPEKYIDAEFNSALRNGTIRGVKTCLTQLDSYWAQGHPRALILSLYLAPMLRWCALYPRAHVSDWFDLGAYPALLRLCRDLEQRPSAAALVHAEGLGPTPFSAPSAPNPPEGSPL
jgi:glutathione S-transferase